jgi:hypothetical protein
MDDPGGFAALAGAGLVGLLIALGVTIGSVLLGVWILYTVIWRAVRRGIREAEQTVPGYSYRA